MCVLCASCVSVGEQNRVSAHVIFVALPWPFPVLSWSVLPVHIVDAACCVAKRA